ncbi:MAG: hypothetical protein KAQ83_02145 [Nanoarchaeota archaeon]|nr:hypothetical protein [Nanoarchaeota archaeon]
MATLDVSLIYNSLYLRMFIGGLILYSAHFFLLIDKVKVKIEKCKEDFDKKLEKENGGKIIYTKTFIEMYELVRSSRNEYSTIFSTIKSNIISGVIFLIGCLIGFITKLNNFSEDLAILLVLIGAIIFLITLIQMIYWYFQK